MSQGRRVACRTGQGALAAAAFRCSRHLDAMTQPPSDREQEIRAAFDSGRMQDAATAVLAAYGDEILSFIHSRLRDRVDSDEAFAMFAEDLWNGLPSFGWRSSVRTWAYTLARNATIRYASTSDR